MEAERFTGFDMKSVEGRFHSRIQKNANGCWIWVGALVGGPRHFYGGIRIGGKTVRANRLSYEMHVGPIPAGMFVCHKCDVSKCVNPEHLFVGTHSENMIDSVVKKRHRNSKRTHCPLGHPLDDANLLIIKRSNGSCDRKCRTCNGNSCKKYYHAKKISSSNL